MVNIKKYLLPVIVIWLASIISFIIVGNSAYSTAIYYVPHADDETLSMGPSILYDIEKGKEVIVLLLSKGTASKAIVPVNQRLMDEGYPVLSKEEFGEARVNEFKKSAFSLGVKLSNVHVYNLSDGNFDRNELESIMKNLAKAYPDSRHYAMTYLDPHPDHKLTGAVLRELKKDGVMSNTRYILPIQEHGNIEDDGGTIVPAAKTEQYFNSLNSYNIWSPQEGFYQIGATSVTGYFEMAKSRMETRWHN